MHPTKSLTPIKWLSFGVVNRFLNKLTVMVKTLQELAKYDIDVPKLLLAVPK